MELLLYICLNIYLELIDTFLNQQLINGKLARKCACKARKCKYAQTRRGKECAAHNGSYQQERGSEPCGKTCKSAQQSALDACLSESDEQTADAACAYNGTDDAVNSAAVPVVLSLNGEHFLDTVQGLEEFVLERLETYSFFRQTNIDIVLDLLADELCLVLDIFLYLLCKLFINKLELFTLEVVTAHLIVVDDLHSSLLYLDPVFVKDRLQLLEYLVGSVVDAYKFLTLLGTYLLDLFNGKLILLHEFVGLHNKSVFVDNYRIDDLRA